MTSDKDNRPDGENEMGFDDDFDVDTDSFDDGFDDGFDEAGFDENTDVDMNDDFGGDFDDGGFGGEEWEQGSDNPPQPDNNAKKQKSKKLNQIIIAATVAIGGGIFMLQMMGGGGGENPAFVAQDRSQPVEQLPEQVARLPDESQPPQAFGVRFGEDIQYQPEPEAEGPQGGILNDASKMFDVEQKQLEPELGLEDEMTDPAMNEEAETEDGMDMSAWGTGEAGARSEPPTESGGLPMPSAVRNESGGAQNAGLLPMPSPSQNTEEQDMGAPPSNETASANVREIPTRWDRAPSNEDITRDAPFGGNHDLRAAVESNEIPAENLTESSAAAGTMNISNQALQDLSDKLDNLTDKIGALESKVAAVDDLQKNINSLEAKINRLERSPSNIQTGARASSEAKRSTSEKATPQRSPESRPAPRQVSVSWSLKAAKPGEAILARSGSQDRVTVKIGDTVAGLGRITSISQIGGKWSVKGTNGSVEQ